jgi:hypothetical protein
MSTVSLEDFVESLLPDIDDGIANSYLLKNRLLKSPTLLKHFKFKTDMDHFSFSDALAYLKQGRCVGRSSWNNTPENGSYLYLEKGSFDGHYLGFTNGSQPSLDHKSTIDAISLGLFEARYEGDKTILPSIYKLTTVDMLVQDIPAWVPSTNDLLAIDWYIVS